MVANRDASPRGRSEATANRVADGVALVVFGLFFIVPVANVFMLIVGLIPWIELGFVPAALLAMVVFVWFVATG